jgi:hypothetical protein
MEESQVKLTKKGTPITEFASQLSKEDADKQGKRWLVLRNKTRLRIIDLLNRYDGLLCVTEVAEVLQESTSAFPATWPCCGRRVSSSPRNTSITSTIA